MIKGKKTQRKKEKHNQRMKDSESMALQMKSIRFALFRGKMKEFSAWIQQTPAPRQTRTL